MSRELENAEEQRPETRERHDNVDLVDQLVMLRTPRLITIPTHQVPSAVKEYSNARNKKRQSWDQSSEFIKS